MRKMRGKSLGEDGICTVVEHIIIKNMWEYYILKTDLDEDDDSYKTALVVESTIPKSVACLCQRLSRTS